MPAHSSEISLLRVQRRVLGNVVLAAFVAAASTQIASAQQTTQVHDASALKPPPGARVAIVEFEDMECPVCASDNPTLKQAAAQYKIPWVRHDFPLQQHIWSFQAAVNARWFDTKSKKLGDDYRDAVFDGQRTIYNLNVLLDFTQKFASSHGVALPMAVDPMGKLSAEVKADYDLGLRTGIDHTPTVWVVASDGKSSRFVEVPTNLSTLYTTIDKALSDTRGAVPSASKKKTAGR